MAFDRAALDATITAARRALLDARNADGYWDDDSASGAFANATAVFALHRYRLASNNAADIHALDCRCAQQIAAGLNWLALNQQSDGAWGDASWSKGQLGTTLACWAAFTADSAAAPRYANTVAAAEAWLATTVGGLAADRIAATLVEGAGTGAERRFTVPILAMCALAGRLGEVRDAWKRVPPLPAGTRGSPLVAIDLARDAHRPSLNPIVRAGRAASRGRTLRLLQTLQSADGSYADALPVTSFVVMGLCDAGEVEHPAVRRGVEHLLRSARDDGSWPVNSVLAIRVTAMAIAALRSDRATVSQAGTSAEEGAEAHDRARLRAWILSRPARAGRPNTGETACELLALHDAREDAPALRPTRSSASNTAEPLQVLRQSYDADAPTRAAAVAGIEALLALQSVNGHLGAGPSDHRDNQATALALRAFQAGSATLEAPLRARVHDAALNAAASLVKNQRPDGSWVATTFDHPPSSRVEHAIQCTACVLRAAFSISLKDGLPLDWPQALWRGVRWLLDAQRADGGWGEEASRVESSALALEALAHVLAHDRAVRAAIDPERDDHWAVFHKMDEVLIDGEQDAARVGRAVENCVAWLVQQTARGTKFDSPPPDGHASALVAMIRTVAALAQARAALGS